jgi:predicted amidophosphoribosyltransferase
MGTKTDKLVEQLADTHKRLRDSSSRSGMSAQDRALLERQIAKLEGLQWSPANTLVVDLVIRTLERVRRHLQEVGAVKTQTLNKNS